jgi:PAS domain S-box-containing protein
MPHYPIKYQKCREYPFMSTPQEDPQPISLLCVGNDVSVLDDLKKYFERLSDFSVFICTTPSGALGLISQYQFDAIISDYAMSDMDGISLLKEIRAQNDPALFIIFTGRHITQVAIETLNNGGNYYVQKSADVLFSLQKVEGFIRTSVHNRRMTQRALGSDMRYRSLLEQQPDLLCCFLPDGTCTFSNIAYADFIGRKEREIPQTNFLAIIPHNERQQIQKHLSALTLQNAAIYIEHHVLDSKGECLLFQWSYRASFNNRGSVLEYMAQGRDLSYVVRINEILPHGSLQGITGSTLQVVSPPSPGYTAVAELANLADSVEQFPYPIFAVDIHGVVIAWNRAIAELTGIDSRTIIGKGNYAYAFPIYGEPRPMLIDSILKAVSGQDITSFPGITRDGDTYTGNVEHVIIRGEPTQFREKGTPVFDSKGNVIAAVQSLLISGESLREDEYDTGDEHYIGGVSSIVLKIAGEGIGGAIAGAIGSTTGGYGVYATDKRLLVVHNPELDASRNEGMQFGEFIVGELFGTTVDTNPRSIADLEKIKVFEVWRDCITSIEMKTPRFLAGFLVIRTASGGSYRIFVDHKKAFLHLEQLLDLFYPNIIRMDTELDDEDLKWLDEIRVLELVSKLQPEDPFKDIPHEETTNLPRIPFHPSISVSLGQSRLIAKSIENVPYPIFAIDRQGVVIAWNMAITRLTGIDPWEMIGKDGYAYSFPFYGESKPMLIDYILMPPDSRQQGEPPVITREGDTFIGSLETVTIRGKPMFIWGKGTGIYDTQGTAIGAIQSIFSSEQPNINTLINTFEEEQYLGGLSSITMKMPGNGVIGAIEGDLGSATGGYGIYVTDQRIAVIHNPEMDAIRTKTMQFGVFIMDELFGTTVDTNPWTIAELTSQIVFEVARKDIITIEMKKPLLFAGYIALRTKSGEAFRAYIDHKLAFIHFEQLLRLYYPEILRIG